MRALGASRTSLVPGGVLAGPWVKNELWRKARAVPSLDLRFADNKSLVDAVTGASLVTFTRASSGLFVGSNGVLQTAVTNLLLRSEEFDQSPWALFGTASRSANVATAPNGTLTADSVTIPISSGIFQGVTSTAGLTLTFSVYIRCNTTQTVRILINTNLSDPVTKTVTATTEWQRFDVTKTTAAGTNLATPQVDTGNGNTFFLWGAQLEQSSTVGEYIPTTSAINSAPRFDHNPTTGESLGLLVEEQRTNSVTNNTMVGAVAGTPGTNPTGWIYATTQSNGLTLSIVGTGVENGINYIDYRFNGTTVASPNACAIGFVNATAATAQTWTASMYWKLAAGSATGVTNWQLGLIENTAGGIFVTGAFYSQTAPTSAALNTQRPTATRTLSGGATVGLLTYPINIAVAGNTAIDLTIRIGLPQLEQGAFATSPILTTTAAATRNADVASITGSALTSFYNQSEGVMFASGDFANAGATSFSRPIALAGANTGIDEISFYTRISVGGGNGSIFGAVTVNSSLEGDLAAPIGEPDLSGGYRSAIAYKANNFGLSSNGLTPTVDTSGTLPTITQLIIMGNVRFQNRLSGHVRRLTYWPQRLANSTLQQITQ